MEAPLISRGKTLRTLRADSGKCHDAETHRRGIRSRPNRASSCTRCQGGKKVTRDLNPTNPASTTR
jgi:hypothetical protein